MRISTKFSDSIHLLSFISIFKTKKLTSEFIASSIKTSPVVVRRMIGELRLAGLISPYQGGKSPQLSRPPVDISLFDIYSAVEHKKPLFNIDKDTNPHCPVGAHVPDVLHSIYSEAEAAAFGQLGRTTLQDVIDRIQVAHQRYGESAVEA